MFVWMEVAGVRVYSFYFSPDDPFEVFETQIRAYSANVSSYREHKTAEQ